MGKIGTCAIAGYQALLPREGPGYEASQYRTCTVDMQEVMDDREDESGDNAKELAEPLASSMNSLECTQRKRLVQTCNTDSWGEGG